MLLGDVEMMDDKRNYDQALIHYKEALKYDHNNINVLLRLAKALERTRDFQDAMDCYNKALTIDKDCFVAHYRIGLIYVKNNMRESGISSLKKALEIEPDHVDILIKLSELLLKDPSQIKEAEKYAMLAH
jgi:tetratricopeptide (TPR) repeat protein